MNTRGQLGRWVRTASKTERITTACTVVVVLVFIGAALVPAPVVRRGASNVEQTVAAERRQLPEVNASTVTATSSTLVGGFAGSGAGAGAAKPGDARREAGTSATTVLRKTEPIKLGFTSISVNTAVVVFGYEPNYRKDVPKAIDAYVDYANKNGGVAGRQIDAVTVEPDFASRDDQRQKCIELTETHNVFGVIDSFAFSDTTATACITAEHQTLLLSGNPLGSANIRAESPYHVSMFKDDNRKMKDLVAASKAAGFFDRAKGFRRLAVLDTNCVPSILDAPADGLFAYLRTAGIEWTEFRMDCNPVRARENAQRAILQMRDDGVTHVLLVLNPPNFKTYLDEAATSGFKAEYFTSDWGLAVVGGLTDEFNPTVFDGALAVTETRAGEALSPLAAKCSGILTDHGLPPINPFDAFGISDDVEVLELCENLFLFLEVANRTNGDLTRASWVAALPRAGDFRGAVVDLARFTPKGKLTGGDTTKIVQWRKGCRCWSRVTDFAPADG